jgi:hypothetical protein
MIRRPNADMQYLVQTYRGLYNKDLEAEMRSEFSGNAQYLFTTLCQVSLIISPSKRRLICITTMLKGTTR